MNVVRAETSGSSNRSVDQCDVVVIGGGPAGSTAATLLSDRGWDVTILDKDVHPRFHIGESLLPCNLPLFDELGVSAQLEQIGVVKPGIDFTLPEGGHPVTFKFAEALGPVPKSAYQVRRAEFDDMLIKNAASRGVTVREGVKVVDVDLASDSHVSVEAADADGNTLSAKARFLIDASGRDTFLGRRLGTKGRIRNHESAALFAHFKGVERRSGEDAGNISIYWFDHGWIWMIPLRDEIVSIGVVAKPAYLQSRRGAAEPFLLESLKLSRPAAARIKDAEMITPATATGNYSYMCRSNWGRNYVMVGDAFAFVDPVFSSGVYFAMRSGSMASGAVDAWLHDPKKGRAALRKQESEVRRGIRNLFWFIRRFNRPALRYMFMNPRNKMNIRPSVITLLAGEVYGNARIFVPLLMFKAIYFVVSLAKLEAKGQSPKQS